MARLAPISDGFFNQRGLGVMLCEELRLGSDQLRIMGFDCWRSRGLDAPR